MFVSKEINLQYKNIKFKIKTSLKPSPIVEIVHPVCQNAGVKLYLKRDDLVHETIIGNKWRKLKYNLIAAKEMGFETLLSFGGAFSNHIHALAMAGKAYGFGTIGIIRGQELSPTANPSLIDAQQAGMQLIFVDRITYQNKVKLAKEYGSHAYILPEGGSNLLAIKGVAELGLELAQQIKAQYVAVPMGTGGTMVGLCHSAAPSKVLGYSVLKNFVFDPSETPYCWLQNDANFELRSIADGLRYGQTDTSLLAFIKDFENSYGIVLDKIYTARMIRAVLADIASGSFALGSSIVAIHTGGQQGNRY
jgi:1-aminocyclopropane-1-carboxylate deaminase